MSFSEFSRYIESNDVKNVQRMLQEGKVDPSKKDNMALEVASERGYTEIVRLLLEDERVFPNHVVMRVYESNNIEMLNLFLDYISVRSVEDLFDRAYSDRRNDIIEFLINHPMYEILNPRPFIVNAAWDGRTDIVRILLENGREDPRVSNNSAIIRASENGHADVVRLLLQDGRADPSDYNNSAIIRASQNGHADVVSLLLEDGRSDPSYYNNSAIIRASRKGRADVVELLLEDERVDPRSSNYEAIRFARNDEIAMMLIKWYAEHDVPIDEFFNVMDPRYNRYILLYYDINDIPLGRYYFGVNPNDPNDRRFVEFVLPRFDYDPETRERFLRLIGFDVDNTSSVLSTTFNEINIPRGVGGLISRFSY
jgi:hypothetical protein